MKQKYTEPLLDVNVVEDHDVIRTSETVLPEDEFFGQKMTVGCQDYGIRSWSGGTCSGTPNRKETIYLALS